MKRKEAIARLRHELLDDSGFSLTELMVVIVIIGILALIAIPRFRSVTTRAKMTEAKSMLRQVHVLQEAYYYEYDKYAADLGSIGFEQVRLISEGGTARYEIRVESAGAAEYTATATSTVDFDKDGTFNVWQVNQAGAVSQRTSD